MNTISSGCYVIDSDYNVISVNQTAHEIYPQLEVGKKCYCCLSGIDEPCGPCPVMNQVRGPRTYRDPIRNIDETVDAVEIPLEGHGLCHALIFSTVGENAEFAATLPASFDDLKQLAIIQALTDEFCEVFSVNLSTLKMSVYRDDKGNEQDHNIFPYPDSYEENTQAYVSIFVKEEDRERVFRQSSIENILEQLKSKESFSFHYRTETDGDVHYYRTNVVRVGNADSFDHVIFGVISEDTEVYEHLRNLELKKDISALEYDSVTGLYTKEAFLIRGEQLREENPDMSFDFCELKIENLGMIRLQYGSPVGEWLLDLVARKLKKYKDETTCLAYTGEGVFICFRGTTSQEIRRKGVSIFEKDVKEECKIKNLDLEWAVYVAADRNLSVEKILEETSYALSSIGTDTRENYVEFNHEMIEKRNREKAIENRFEEALEKGEFSVWYQPKIQVKTGKITGAEALVRWTIPGGELLSPASFIPILENCGKIGLLDEFVFRQACLLQEKLAGTFKSYLPISVNLSRVSIFTGSVAETYSKIAGEYRIPVRCIPLEITESAGLQDEVVISTINELDSLGFSLDMDDFGTGYSSIASLQMIPFKTLKIDKSLVDNIGRDTSDSILKHVIGFCRESGIKTVAEGVETYEQYLFLKIAGCDLIQGYYFSKPVPEDVFLEMLKKQEK
ncbi:MAG: EAL domain-containing protein [Eubacterium sp.]